MTQHRKRPDAISNWLDDIERGIGKRGSSFTDIDAASHDIETHRFLFRELKEPGEQLDKAQRWILRDLAALPGCTVWFIRRLQNGNVGFGHFRSGRRQEEISITEYQRRFCCWWDDVDYMIAPAPATVDRMLTAAEIFGGRRSG